MKLLILPVFLLSACLMALAMGIPVKTIISLFVAFIGIGIVCLFALAGIVYAWRKFFGPDIELDLEERDQ